MYKLPAGLGLVIASLAVAGAAAYFVESSASDDTAATATTAPEPEATPDIYEDYGERTRRAYQEAVATAEAEMALPRFLGVLGDFEIVADEAVVNISRLCGAGNRPSRDKDFVESELNLPGMRLQKVCADGSVVGTWSEDGSRQYFEGRAKILLEGPRETMELVEVDGHPALIVRPAGGIGTRWAFAIQRMPSYEQYGILIWTNGETRDEAIAAVRRELGR